MKNLLLIISFSVILFSCQKENIQPSDTSNHLRCIDITPDIYSFMRGKWIICGQRDNNAIPTNTWTYNFITVGNGHDSIPMDTLITTQTDSKSHYIISCDTFLYHLARDYNLDIITGIRLRDSAAYFDVWEIRADNSFYLGDWKLCK